jgi:hypothetical protein
VRTPPICIDRGRPGPRGRKGAQGKRGLRGVQGETGAPGSQGETGITGSTGITGTTGLQGLQGQIGTVGPQGTAGTQGTVGASGPTGPQGPIGNNGSAGPTGSAGAVGPTGAAGVAGPTGAAGVAGTNGLAEYAYVYNVGAQVVAIEADIDFDTNGVATPGITHAPGATQIAVTSAGDYKVSFTVSGVEPNQFGLFVNGVPATVSIYGSGAGTQQNTGQAILTLGSGDVLTLRNHSSAAAVTLQTVAGGTQQNVNASIVVEKLS